MYKMLIEGLKKKLCRDLLVETDQTDVDTVAITSFSYPNGDSVNLYFSGFGDTLAVSDEGATVDFLHAHNIELPADRRDTIKTMCRPYEVEFATPVLRRFFQMPEIGPASMALCEAITRVAAISYQAVPQLRSSLPLAVDTLLRKRVMPRRGVERQWIAKRQDPKGSFPVDFRVNGLGEPRHIFSVTSSSKSILAVAVVNFLRSHRINVPTLAIVDLEAGLGPRDTNRLQLTVSDLSYGIEGNEEKIVRFALADQ